MRWTRAVAVLVATVATATGVAAQTGAPGVVEVVTLSNRADLISGGDALVEVVVPDGVDPSEVTVVVGQRDVTDGFAVREDGRFIGLVDGMAPGANRITATLVDGSGAYLDVTNHARGGPVFSGPQLEPWLCETEALGLEPATDADCNAPTLVEWFYMSTDGDGFQPYDVDNPPDDVATTTTDQGVEAPYVVRRETGTINRAIYRTAVLADPAQPVAPWAPGPWNHKLHYLYGGGAQPNWRQGDVLDEVLDDNALSRGFAVAQATSNLNAQNTDTVRSAETAVMLKEHLVEQFGEIRYTLSRGGSGGSIQQHLIANAYPGVTDGLIPDSSFMDMFTTANEGVDCALLNRYYTETSPHLWAVERQQTAVNGQGSVGPCREWDVALNLDAAWMDPRIGCLADTINPVPSLPEAEWVYDPVTNPTGARCTLQDLDVALFGTRPREAWGPVEQQIGRGFANRPYDNVGVQYGLAALEAGTILAEQFVDLNEHVGGWDIDYGWQPERSVADPFALDVAYRTGQMNDAAHVDVPIIDDRGLPSNHDIHTYFRSWAMRARLDKAHGHHDNHVIWTTNQPSQTGYSPFAVMDAWLAAIEADTSDRPLVDKVAANRPEDAVDSCWVGSERITDEAQCRTIYPYYGDPRIAAGGPFTDDVLKCQLKPLDPADYSVAFSDEQWARLQAAFPDGVCDYTLPGVAQQPSIPWLTFLAEDGSVIPGGQPLGEAPLSVPFGPDGPPPLVTRHGGPGRIDTAVAVSSLGVDAADTVVLARADDYADALAGAPLAVHLGAPLLLTSPEQLSAATAAEITRLGATQAVLLGGEAALGDVIQDALTQAGLTVRRLAGTTRYATAVAIAADMPRSGQVLLARGDAFADALAASALGAATGTPVLLTRPDALPPETATALDAATDVIIVGGEVAVSAAVASAADAASATVARLAGATRYATSAAVADAAIAAGATPAITWVATGRDFPDALVAGAAAGRDHGVLLLIDGHDLTGSPETSNWLTTHQDLIHHLHIAGGTVAITPTVETALGQGARTAMGRTR